jgi:hypothetical protein
MARLDFEGAIVCPQVDRGGDACNTAFVYHLCSLRAGNGEFKIGIFLPVSKQQRKLRQEPVVGVSDGGDGLGVGVAIDSAFESFSAANKLFP